MEYKFFSRFTVNLVIYITGVSSVSLVPSSNPVAVGGNVTLTLNPATIITAGNWLFESNVLVFWYPGNVILEESYTSRISFNSSSVQLALRSLQLNDSGLYTLKGAMPLLRAQVALSVQEPVTNVSVAVSLTNLVEFNDSATFTCSAQGSLLKFSWRNSSSELTRGNSVQLSSDGSILTITNVTRYDQGPFTCVVANGISNETSRTIYLNINYGPSNLTMTVMPLKIGYISGSDITLSCSADSRPPTLFFWSYNNVTLNKSGQTLQLKNASQNQTGSYTCTAHNTVTLRYTTASTTIFVLDPISSATVIPSGLQPVFNMSITLSCATVGPVDSTYWVKNDVNLHSDERISLSDQNKTLTFNQLTLSDDGDYQCVAINTVSNMTSVPYRLSVNYGPWNTTISGPAIAAADSSVVLNCSASSQPPSEYYWYFNGSPVAEGSTYKTGVLSLNSNGEYICFTHNNVTGRSGGVIWTLTVIDPISSATVIPSGLQPVFNMSFNLSCTTVGPVDSTYWVKNDVNLHSDERISLSDQNKTLTFNQLTLSDDGDYQCVAINAVSNMTSVPYRLSVNYGPWSSTISGPAIGEAGSSVTLNCSAPSQPPSEYSWYFSGSSVAKGPVFETGALSLNSSGQYICMAHNNITGSHSTAMWNLTVIEAISVVVTPSMLIPLASNDLQLFCNIRGHYSSIQWLKDGLKFSTTPAATVSMDNTTLSFQPLLTDDDGTYQCAATNVVGQHVSKPYKLTANYGPVNLTITAEVGVVVILICDATSQPTSVYQWFMNTDSFVGEGSQIVSSAMLTPGYNYTCVARNPLTNVTVAGTYSVPDAVASLQVSVLLTTSLALILAVSVL